MSRTDFPKVYNPASQSRKDLIENFVVRTKLFKEIYEDIKSSKMNHPEQHYIIQGVRGQGKTTLLCRIAYELSSDKSLNKRIIPILFNEEQYNITRLFKLWETTADYMKEVKGFEELYDNMQKLEENSDFESKCFQLLEDSLKFKKKKLILFIDNIDEMLTKFSKQEHHRLREVFMESSEIRIIGASSVSLEFHYDYGQPFYQFFRMPHLKGLSAEETKTLLLKLGEQYKRERIINIVNTQPGRIEALRRMTAGVIRNIIILFDLFVDDEDGNSFADLEKVLDTVTPLYKHRMDKLSSQQQEIVDCIALNWDAINTGEISKKIKMESKAVSAQLKILTKYNIIEKEKTNTKNFLYRISERFFNIWYLMRLGRKWDEKRVKFLVEFLQIWCDEKELEVKAKKQIRGVKSNKVTEKQALYLTEALASTPIKRNLQHNLIKECRSFLEKSYPELAKYLSKSDKELIYSAVQALDCKDFQKAITNIEKIKRKDKKDWATLGSLYLNKNRNLKKAEKYLKLAANEGDLNSIHNLALLYHKNLKDVYKAEKYYKMAAQEGNLASMNNLGALYSLELKDYKKAEKYFKLAAQKGHLASMKNLGSLYSQEIKNFKKAEKYYLMAVKNGSSSAMYNLGNIYTDVKDFNKAEKYLLLAIINKNSTAIARLALLYFENHTKKKEALHFATAAYQAEPHCKNVQTYSSVLLWNNEVEKSYTRAQLLFSTKVCFEKCTENVNFYLLFLIAKRQYHLTLKLFNENPFNLKDRFKPVYYALMYFMQDEYPNEYLKMGGELKQTVEEIIERIGQLEKDYK